MVTRKKLEEMYKIKIMLKGDTGTGKTMTCVKIAEYVARHNHKVLYLDFERGSTDELLKLDDDILSNIILEEFASYKDLVTCISKHHKDNDIKLIIIDQMPLKEISRLSARDTYIQQGFYYIGEKKKFIADEEEDSFDLRGFMYQLPNTWQIKFLNSVVRSNQDIICTLMTPNKYEDEYNGKFSIILNTLTTYIGHNIIWKAIPKKMRGVDLSNYPPITNPWESLLVLFIKKYGTDEEIESAKQEMEKKNRLHQEQIIKQQAEAVKRASIENAKHTE